MSPTSSARGAPRALLTGLASLTIAFCAGADDTRLTVDQAVARALRDSPTIQFASASVAAKEQELNAARRGGLPTLAVDLSGLYASGEPTSFFTLNRVPVPEEPLGHTSGYYAAGSLVLTVPLYQNGSFFNMDAPAVLLADGNYNKARSENLGQAADVANQTAKAYLDALSAAEETELQEAAYKRLANRLDYVRQRVQARVATRADELVAEAALAAKSADLNAARRRQDLQRLQLGALLGLPHTQRPIVVKLTPRPPSLPPLERLLDETLAAQPAIKSQQAVLDVARAQLAAQRGADSAKLSFVASSTAAHGQYEGTETATFNSVGLKLTVPLLDFGQNQARVRARDKEVIEQEHRLKLARDTAVQMVYAAYYGAQDAFDKHDAAGKSLAQAQFQEQVTAAKFSKGLVGLDTLIQDEASALAAEVQMMKSRYGLWSAYADVLKAVGKPFASQPALGAP